MLLGCPELLKYIPGNPEGSQMTPKLICLKCLDTVHSRCCHYSMPDHEKYFCLVGKQYVILCRCTKHKNVRTWMRTNFNLNRIHHLNSLWKEIKSHFSSPSENDEPWVENNPTQQSKSAFSSENSLISNMNAMHLNETDNLKPATSSN